MAADGGVDLLELVKESVGNKKRGYVVMLLVECNQSVSVWP